MERETAAQLTDLRKNHDREIAQKEATLREVRRELENEIGLISTRKEEEWRSVKDRLERASDEQAAELRRRDAALADAERRLAQLSEKVATLTATNSDLSSRLHTGLSEMAERNGQLEVRAAAGEKQSAAVKQALELTIHEQTRKLETLLVEKHALEASLATATQSFESQLALQKETAAGELQRTRASLTLQLEQTQGQLAQRERDLAAQIEAAQTARLELGEAQRRHAAEIFAKQEQKRQEVARVESRVREAGHEVERMQQSRDMAKQDATFAEQRAQQMEGELHKLKKQLLQRDEELANARAEVLQGHAEKALELQKARSSMEEESYIALREAKARAAGLEGQLAAQKQKLLHQETIISKLSKNGHRNTGPGDSAGLGRAQILEQEVGELQQRELRLMETVRKRDARAKSQEQELIGAQERVKILENQMASLKQAVRGQSTQIIRLKQERDKLIVVSGDLRAQLKHETPRSMMSPGPVFGPNVAAGIASPSLIDSANFQVVREETQPARQEEQEEDVDSSINREELAGESKAGPDSTLERGIGDAGGTEILSPQPYQHPFQVPQTSDSFPSFKSPEVGPSATPAARLARDTMQEPAQKDEETQNLAPMALEERLHRVADEPVKDRDIFIQPRSKIALSRPFLKKRVTPAAKEVTMAQLKQEYSEFA